MKKIMIYPTVLLALVVFVPLGARRALHAGRQQSDILVDGSQHPELIPDERAYHIVLLTASATARSTELVRKRAEAVVANLHLGGQDSQAFADLAVQYRKGLEDLQDQQRGLPIDSHYQQAQADI